MSTLFAFGFTPTTIVLLLLLGVLLFGRNLPQMGKYLGKGIVEFKKGLRGFEDEIDGSVTSAPRPDPASLEAPRPPQRVATTAPKFEDNAGAIQQAPGVQSTPTQPPPKA